MRVDDLVDARRELTPAELICLNADELDVEELEARLEMAAALPNADCWVNCTVNIGV
jgi:hypothetical protein